MKLRELLSVYHGTHHTKQVHDVKVSIECIHAPEVMNSLIENYYESHNYQIDHRKSIPNVSYHFETVYCGEMKIDVNKSIKENTGLTEDQLDYNVLSFDVFDNGLATWVLIKCTWYD